ncbi:MAG: translocation/assembly module TamB domain-containing protein [Candidatus Eiseniibacteriota bacterium]
MLGATGVALGLAVAALAIVLVGLHTDAGRAWVLEQATARVGEAAGLTIDAAHLDGSLLGAFTLHDVTVRAAADARDRAISEADGVAGIAQPWIEAASIRVDWRPLELLARRVHVVSLAVDAARVDLPRRRAGDRRDAPAAAEAARGAAADTSSTVAPWTIALDALRIDRASLVVSAGVTIDSLNAALGGRLELARPLAIALRLDALRARWRERDLALSGWQGPLELRGDATGGGARGAVRWERTTGQLAIELGGAGYVARLSAAVPGGQLARFADGLGDHPAFELEATVRGALRPAEGRRLGGHSLELGARSGAGRVDLAARIDDPSARATLAVEALDPGRWWRGAPGGSLTLGGELSLARIDRPLDDARARLTLGRGRLGAVALTRGALDVRTSPIGYVLEALELEATGTRVEATGRYADPRDAEATLAARFDDLAVWGDLLDLPLGGRCTLDGHLSSRAAGARGRLGIDADACSVGSWSIDDADLGLDLQGSGKTGSDLRVRAQGTLSAVGRPGLRCRDVALGGSIVQRGLLATGAGDSARWRGPTEFDLELDARIDSVSGAAFLDGARVRAAAAGERRGPAVAARVRRLVLDAPRLSMPDGEPESLVSLEAPCSISRRAGGAIEVRELACAVAGGRLGGRLARDADGGLAARLEVSSLGLGALERLVPDMPPVAGVLDATLDVASGGPVSDRVAGPGQGDGPVADDRLAGTARVAIDALRLPGRPLVDVDLEATLGARGIDLAVVAHAAPADTLRASGRLPIVLRAASPVWGWQDDALDVRLALAADSLDTWSGVEALRGTHVALRSTLSGPPSAARLVADGRIVPPRHPAVPHALQIDLDAEIGDGRAALELVGVLGEHDVLQARASLPLGLDLVHGVAIDSSLALTGAITTRAFRLATLQHLFGDAVRVAGAVDLDARVDGTLRAPELSGELGLADGRLEIVPLAMVVRDLTMEAAFDNRRLVIRRSEGRTADGVFTLSGSSGTPLTPDAPLDVRLAATRLRFRTPHVERASVDLEIAARGDLERPALSGRVRVNEAVIPVPEQRHRGYLELTDEEVAALGDTTIATRRGGPAPASALPVDLDLDVQIPRNVWLRNRQISIEFGGELEARTGGGTVGLYGKLETVRGRVEFQGKAFDVKRGIVTFIGDENPEIDIDATHRVREWTVHVLLTGSAHEPELTFSSEPPLPESDILSLLLFGRTSNDLSEREQLTLADRATNLISGLAAAQLEQALAAQLGLDLLEINASGRDRNVTVGKYLNQRTMIRVAQDLESGGETVVTVEYALTPRLQIEVSADDEGQSAIDLLFKKDD